MATKKYRKILMLIRKYSKKEESSSIWSYFKGHKKEKKKPSEESCRKRQGQGGETVEHPDFSEFEGTAYRTCGSAYVVQKDVIPAVEVVESDEDRILKRIEADLSNKDNASDTMPKFSSVEQRLIDLNDRRLHPFYKMYMSLPKRQLDQGDQPERPYQCQSGPVKPGEIPEQLKFNKQLLEKKNIFADFKKVELPKQMVVRILEMDKNRKPTLERKPAK